MLATWPAGTTAAPEASAGAAPGARLTALVRALVRALGRAEAGLLGWACAGTAVSEHAAKDPHANASPIPASAPAVWLRTLIVGDRTLALPHAAEAIPPSTISSEKAAALEADQALDDGRGGGAVVGELAVTQADATIRLRDEL